MIVVESREQGGSLITVTEAIERNVPLMAVPGGVHNRAATGTNQLIRDGAGVVVDVTDVLVALAMDHRRSTGAPADPRRVHAAPTSRVRDVRGRAADDRRARSGVLAQPRRRGDGGGPARARGWIQQSDGWFEAVGSPLR